MWNHQPGVLSLGNTPALAHKVSVSMCVQPWLTMTFYLVVALVDIFMGSTEEEIQRQHFS